MWEIRGCRLESGWLTGGLWCEMQARCLFILLCCDRCQIKCQIKFFGDKVMVLSSLKRAFNKFLIPGKVLHVPPIQINRSSIINSRCNYLKKKIFCLTELKMWFVQLRFDFWCYCFEPWSRFSHSVERCTLTRVKCAGSFKRVIDDRKP